MRLPVRIPPLVEPVMSGSSLFLQPVMVIPATAIDAAANSEAIFFRMLNLASWCPPSVRRGRYHAAADSVGAQGCKRRAREDETGSGMRMDGQWCRELCDFIG